MLHERAVSSAARISHPILNSAHPRLPYHVWAFWRGAQGGGTHGHAGQNILPARTEQTLGSPGRKPSSETLVGNPRLWRLGPLVRLQGTLMSACQGTLLRQCGAGHTGVSTMGQQRFRSSSGGPLGSHRGFDQALEGHLEDERQGQHRCYRVRLSRLHGCFRVPYQSARACLCLRVRARVPAPTASA
jgi:hypothetical protein